MWFMIGDTIGTIALLFWQGLFSINKEETTEHMTMFDKIKRSPNEMAEFILQYNKDREGLTLESIIEDLVQEVDDKNNVLCE
jgi:hypothetical protein